MKNISFPKNMQGWSQKEISIPIETDIATLTEEISDNNNFSISLDNEIQMAMNLIENVNVLYAMKACKELHDVRIHLSLSISLLKSVKANLDL